MAGLSPAMPHRIEDLMVFMRSDLLRISEQSGHGKDRRNVPEEGATNDKDVSFFSLMPSQQEADDNKEDDTRENIGGCLRRQSPQPLSSWALFLNGFHIPLVFLRCCRRPPILQSSLQRLNKNSGAADASCATTSNNNDSSGGRSRALRHRQEQQEELNNSTGGSLILVESTKKLAECQQQMVFDLV